MLFVRFDKESDDLVIHARKPLDRATLRLIAAGMRSRSIPFSYMVGGKETLLSLKLKSAKDG